MNPREALATEARRLHHRYHCELIERFSICPWAKPARAAGRTRVHVLIESSCEPDALTPVLDEWAVDDSVDVAFLIVPRFEGDADLFARWAESVARTQGDAFLSAPFFPGVPESAGSIQLLRQTPDPTVQLVRRTLLEQIRAQDPPHYTDIFDLDLRKLSASEAPREVAASVVAHNERTIEREGRPEIQAILDDIREDRARSYAKLLPLL